MAMTLEQQKALALAGARKRQAEQKPDAMAYYREHGIPGFGGTAFANSAVEAIPVVGPWINDRLSDARGAISQLIGGPSKDEMDQSIDISTKGSPVEATAGTIAGTVAPLALAGETALGARLLGMSGGLPSRVVAGSMSGGAIAAADALSRGDPFDDAGQKALIGAATGGGLPIAGKVVGAAWRGLTGKAFDPAETTLARAIRDDQIPVGEVNARLDALGPDAVLADLGPNLQRQAGALASLPGEGQRMVRDALRARAAATNGRITADTDTILGPAVVPSRVDRTIRANMDAVSPEYRDVFSHARAVDTTPIAHELDAQAVNLRGDAQRAIQQVRRMLDIAGEPGNLDPSPETLFQTRQAIDGLMEAEPNSKVIAALTGARRMIDETLARSVPGLKDVDAKFAELARQREGLGQGQQLLDSGRTAARPAEVDEMLTTGALPEGTLVGPSGAAFRLTQGARAEIERIIGTTSNNLTALKTALKGDGSWNRQRLASLFGQGRADQLLDILEREKTYAETDHIVRMNSESAARLAAQEELKGGLPNVNRDLTLPGLVAMLAQKAANVGARTRQAGTNARIAEALMSRQVQGPTLNAVARALMQQRVRAILAPAAVPLLFNGNS